MKSFKNFKADIKAHVQMQESKSDYYALHGNKYAPKGDANQGQKLKTVRNMLSRFKSGLDVTVETDGSLYLFNRKGDYYAMIRYSSKEAPNPFVFQMEGGAWYGAKTGRELMNKLKDMNFFADLI